MVYHLTFEDFNKLMKHQIMNSSKLYGNLLGGFNNGPAGLSENNTLIQCMQKLDQYPDLSAPRVLQEANGQTRAVEVEGQAGCTPRPRWCPTPEQIQVLEALFNSGTTTPSRDMIVEIAACLKQFGSIMEANVFYWFQNRKARAKRKLRMQEASGGSEDLQAGNQQSSYTAKRRRVCPKATCKSSPAATTNTYENQLLVPSDLGVYTNVRVHVDNIKEIPLITAATTPCANTVLTNQAAIHHASRLPSHALIEASHCLLEENCSVPPSVLDQISSTAVPASHQCTPVTSYHSPNTIQDQHYHQQIISNQYINIGYVAQQDNTVPDPTPANADHHNIITSIKPTSQQGPESVPTYTAALPNTQSHQQLAAALIPYSTTQDNFLLPDKRSWMEALQQFLLHGGGGNHMHEADHIGMVVNSLGSSNNDHINLSAQQALLDQNIVHPQRLVDLSRGQFLNPHPSTRTIPSTVCMSLQSDTTSINACKSTSHATPALHEAYQQGHAPSCSPLPTLMSTTSDSTLSLSPPRFPHCDHLPLWEALAPYSIGS